MPEIIHVLITLPFTEEHMARLNNISPLVKCTQVRALKVEDIPLETWAQVQVLYTNRVLPSPEMAPKLRWVQFHWAGVDHALDSPLWQVPGFQATSLSGAASTQVAEYILMMLLAQGHHLPEMLAAQRRNEWPRDRWERFSPRELRNATVGIVGYGSIGRQVARLLYPFGTRVLATKRDTRHPEDRGYLQEGFGDPNGDFVFRLYPAEALRAMLKECDFVVVTVPMTNRNVGLIGAEELASIKPGSFLVDTSRGGIVDHSALVAALRENRLAGAALDVFPEEPLPADNPLWKLPNVILSPHISGNTPAYDDRAIDLFAENLQRYITGSPLYNLVDLNRGY